MLLERPVSRHAMVITLQLMLPGNQGLLDSPDELLPCQSFKEKDVIEAALQKLKKQLCIWQQNSKGLPVSDVWVSM